VKLIGQKHHYLHRRAEEVPQHDMGVTLLIIEMWELMYRHRGIGLAANQVGELQRVIVLHVGSFKQAIINPIITRQYGGKATSKEGCLSYPALCVPMVRDRQIIVEGFDQNWKPIKRKLKGLAAYCVQHEIDHLNGITIGLTNRPPKRNVK